MNWKTILIQGIESAIVIAVSYWIYRLLYGTLKKTARRLGRELKMPNTIRVILGLIIAVIAVMVLLQIWNIDLLPYLAAFGVTGIIIGLALQDPLANLISGFLVLITGKLKEGDVVDVEGTSGVVNAVQVNHTALRSFDGKSVLIPNRQVWNGKVTQFWPGPVRRLSMKVGVSYSSDLKKVLELLSKSLEEEPLVEKEGVSNFVTFVGFGDSSIDFQLLYWVKRENYFAAQKALALRIKHNFDENGIEIPFTQIDLHMKDDMKGK